MNFPWCASEFGFKSKKSEGLHLKAAAMVLLSLFLVVPAISSCAQAPAAVVTATSLPAVTVTKVSEVLVTPKLEVSTLKVSFGPAETASASTAQTITATNTSSFPLTIGTLSVTGANGDQFIMQADNLSGKVVQPGAAATVSFIFKPTSFGAKVGTLSIPSNDPAKNPVNVTLSGTGTVPAKTLAQINTDWKTSPHNVPYNVMNGVNDFCGRCHTPENWRPDSKAGTGAACISCKMPTDATVRNAAPNNILIPPEKYNGIGCIACHKVVDGVVDPTPVKLNMATAYPKASWDPVTNNDETCLICHCDSQGGSKHNVIVGGPAHTAQIGENNPIACLDCHDAHSTKSTCTDPNCHPNTMKPATPIVGHDTNHANVDCTTCHDYGINGVYMLYGYVPNTKNFGGALSVATNGSITVNAFGMLQSTSSHSLIRVPPIHASVVVGGVTVAKPTGSTYCWNCHYADNPWKLSVQK
jgi:hypothetical protein